MNGTTKKLPATPPLMSIPCRRLGGMGNGRQEVSRSTSRPGPAASASAASSTALCSSSAWLFPLLGHTSTVEL